MFWHLHFRGTKDNDSAVLSGFKSNTIMWDRVMSATFATRQEVANFLSNDDKKLLEGIAHDSTNNEFVVWYRPWLSV